MIFVLYAKGYHNFPLKNFCLTVPKNFVEEPFYAVFQGRGKYQDFPSKIFCLTAPRHFVEEPFYAVFQKIFGSEKIYG